MFADGVALGAGLLLMIAKASVKWKLKMLSHPFVMDIIIFLFMCVLHGTTGPALIAAGIASATCSVALSLARYVYGYNDKHGKYVPGFVNLLRVPT